MIKKIMKKNKNTEKIQSSYDYMTTISEEVRKTIEKEVKRISPHYEIKAIIRYKHPEDHYLYRVVALMTSNDTYTYWNSFNTFTNSLNFGHYQISLEEAMQLLWR